jgi:hypothetical protein
MYIRARLVRTGIRQAARNGVELEAKLGQALAHNPVGISRLLHGAGVQGIDNRLDMASRRRVPGIEPFLGIHGGHRSGIGRHHSRPATTPAARQSQLSVIYALDLANRSISQRTC